MQYLVNQLPAWARTDHPLMKGQVKRHRPQTRKARLWRAFVRVAMLYLFVAIGAGAYLVDTKFLNQPIGQTVSEAMIAVLFWPSFVMLVILSLGALLTTTNVVGERVENRSWTNIRSTTHGAELTLRTAWLMVFWRLRYLLALIVLLRLVLIAGILYDLTSFQGRYLSLLINGITPEVPVILALVLLVFLMTTSLLLPFTGLGMDAALGIYIGTFVRHRISVVLFQFVLVGIRVAYVAGLYWLASGVLANTIKVSDPVSWGALALYGGLGDWGVSLLHLSSFGQIMATIPYSIFIGLALMIIALSQAIFADWILNRAIRRAEYLD